MIWPMQEDKEKYVGKRVRIRFRDFVAQNFPFVGTIEHSKQPERYALCAKEGTFFVNNGESQIINRIEFSPRDILEIEEVKE